MSEHRCDAIPPEGAVGIDGYNVVEIWWDGEWLFSNSEREFRNPIRFCPFCGIELECRLVLDAPDA